jgi:hypothetical protein
MQKLTLSFFLVCALFLTGASVALVGCLGTGTMDGGVGINISDQPGWGPTGYDRADFYYIPDIDSYYSVSERQYIYRDGSSWRHGQTLPSTYSGYDPYHSYKAVVTGDKPYLQNDNHRSKYGTFKGNKDQPVIRDSRDSKYFVNRDHPEHDKWVKDHH